MSGICRVLGRLTLIFGLVGAFVLASIYGETYREETFYTTVKLIPQRDWGLTIGIFVGSAFSVVILAVILLAISDIIDMLERHDSILKGAESGLEMLSKQAKDQETISGGGWKCPKCSNINYFHTKRCKCGYEKDSAQPEEDNAPSFGGWQCPVCKRHNMGFEKKCKCGQDKPE